MDVVVVVADGVLLLDVAGPVQVLHWAGYRVRFGSVDGAGVRTDVGVSLGVDGTLAELVPGTGLVLVPGYAIGAPVPDELARAVRGVTGPIASVCTGAFVLAEAGLLDGRRATTHWAACALLARRFPRVRVEPDALFVHDGPVTTAAGVTSGIDMALALVEREQGADAARALAKYLVVFLRRPGGQSQFSTRHDIGEPRHAGLRLVVDAVVADVAADHSLAALARRAAVSERHLGRLFRRETGLTPARFVLRVRVEAAQALLESGDAGLALIARRCGFGSEETMRRAFLDVLATTPSDYRRRFRSAV